MLIRRKLPPALRHAGYSTLALLPGENPAEFEALRIDLIIEYAPAGAVEDDIVATLARLMWRKQNLGSFQKAKEAQERYYEIRREKGADQIADQTHVLLPGPGDVPGVKKRDPQAVSAARQAAVEQARNDLGWTFQFIEIGEIATVDQMMKEIDILERLDAMIDRCLKRLLFVRGLKSLSRGSPAE